MTTPVAVVSSPVVICSAIFIISYCRSGGGWCCCHGWCLNCFGWNGCYGCWSCCDTGRAAVFFIGTGVVVVCTAVVGCAIGVMVAAMVMVGATDFVQDTAVFFICAAFVV